MRRPSMPTASISISVSFALASAALLLLACSSHGGVSDGSDPAAVSGQTTPAPATPAGAEAKSKGVVIATIQTNDSKVSILGRGNGKSTPEADLRVIVRKMDGTLVADGLSIDQLRAVDPLAHAIVTSAVAGNGGSAESSDFVDARYHQASPTKESPAAPRTFLLHGL